MTVIVKSAIESKATGVYERYKINLTLFLNANEKRVIIRYARSLKITELSCNNAYTDSDKNRKLANKQF